MSSKQTMQNQLKDMLLSLQEDEFPVNGFSFTLDDPNKFDPYCWEAATLSGFPQHLTMPSLDGFFYASKEYTTYLKLLLETSVQHPANTENLEWSLHDEPSLATI